MRRLRRPSLRVLLSLALVLAGVGGALAFFASTGAGTASATIGSMSAPTITSATPGAGTVTLTWTAVTMPAGGTVTYYVTRAGGTVGGNCPSSATTATTATSCTDSGLTKGSYSYTVTAVWQSWTATSSSSSATVASGALNHFVVSAPATATAGSGFTVTITAQDAANNTVTNYGGNQALAFSGPSNSPLGSNPAYPASVAFTNGVGSGTVTLYDAQSTTLTASQGAVSGTSGSISVGAGATSQIGTTVPSSPQPTAGTAITVTLTGEDAWGNTNTTFAGTKSVTFSGPANSPSGNAPTKTASVTFSAGTVTTPVTLYDAQTTTITTADTTDGYPGVTGSSFTVAPASASSFTVPAPSSAAAGTAFGETLTALDAYGNVATGYTGSQAVTFSGPASSPNGTRPSYPGSITFTAGVGASASITLSDAQTGVKLTAKQGSVTGTSAAFNVAVGPTSEFTLPAPAGAVAGTAFSEQLTATDSDGNVATGYAGTQTITFTGPSNSPGGNVPTQTASVTFTAGVGSASVTLYDAQSTTLTATQGAVTGTSSSFTVSPAAPNRLSITSTAVDGATSATANLGPITVQESDKYGNLTTSAETVSLVSTGATGEFATSQFGTSVTSVTIPSGTSSTSFYYGNTATGTPTITASATGLTAATQQETIASAPVGLGITLASGSGSLSCTAVSASYTCAITGMTSGSTANLYVSFVNSSGTPVVYSTTQASTITESGQGTGSVTIAAGASSSSPNTLSVSAGAFNTYTVAFGPYKVTIIATIY